MRKYQTGDQIAKARDRIKNSKNLSVKQRKRMNDALDKIQRSGEGFLSFNDGSTYNTADASRFGLKENTLLPIGGRKRAESAVAGLLQGIMGASVPSTTNQETPKKGMSDNDAELIADDIINQSGGLDIDDLEVTDDSTTTKKSGGKKGGTKGGGGSRGSKSLTDKQSFIKRTLEDGRLGWKLPEGITIEDVTDGTDGKKTEEAYTSLQNALRQYETQRPSNGQTRRQAPKTVTNFVEMDSQNPVQQKYKLGFDNPVTGEYIDVTTFTPSGLPVKEYNSSRRSNDNRDAYWTVRDFVTGKNLPSFLPEYSGTKRGYLSNQKNKSANTNKPATYLSQKTGGVIKGKAKLYKKGGSVKKYQGGLKIGKFINPPKVNTSVPNYSLNDFSGSNLAAMQGRANTPLPEVDLSLNAPSVINQPRFKTSNKSNTNNTSDIIFNPSARQSNPRQASFKQAFSNGKFAGIDSGLARALGTGVFNLLNKKRVVSKKYEAPKYMIRPAEGMPEAVKQDVLNRFSRNVAGFSRVDTSDPEARMRMRLAGMSQSKDFQNQLSSQDAGMLRQDEMRYGQEMNRQIASDADIRNTNIEMENQDKLRDSMDLVKRRKDAVAPLSQYLGSRELARNQAKAKLYEVGINDTSEAKRNLFTTYQNKMKGVPYGSDKYNALKNQYNKENAELQKQAVDEYRRAFGGRYLRKGGSLDINDRIKLEGYKQQGKKDLLDRRVNSQIIRDYLKATNGLQKIDKASTTKIMLELLNKEIKPYKFSTNFK